MVTPEEARKLADFVSDAAWSEPGPLCSYKFDGAAAALRDLAAQVKALQADAERYRWLRNSENAGAFLGEKLMYVEAGSVEFDQLIDAARKDQP